MHAEHEESLEQKQNMLCTCTQGTAFPGLTPLHDLLANLMPGSKVPVRSLLHCSYSIYDSHNAFDTCFNPSTAYNTEYKVQIIVDIASILVNRITLSLLSRGALPNTVTTSPCFGQVLKHLCTLACVHIGSVHRRRFYIPL